MNLIKENSFGAMENIYEIKKKKNVQYFALFESFGLARFTVFQ